MARVLVPLAEGFEEIETSTIVDVLRRAKVEVVLAGLDGAGAAVGSRGISFVPDMAYSDAAGPWDLVVLPGGMGGTERLAAHAGLKALLAERVAADRPVAAICAAPMALDRAGVLQDVPWTCYPGLEARIEAEGRSGDRVVDAGTVITSQGPGTAMAFALALVGRLCGEGVRDEVATGLLFAG